MVDTLVAADHPARLIWEIVNGLDLSAFEQEVASFEREVGRPRWSPQVLISVLVYGYTVGTGSARELERLMETEPGLRWLCGLEKVNHHTLSDFRVEKTERLQTILTQVLALLANEELVDFTFLLQDGTKIQAQASAASFRRRKTVGEHLAEAEAYVKEMDARAATENEAGNETGAEPKKRTKKEAAQARAARERLERMKAAQEELERRQAATKGQAEQVRVSESEPEARKMKQAHGGFAPSYNLQLVTEGRNGFVVGWSVSSSTNDLHELAPALAMAQSCTGQKVEKVVADSGYASRANVEQLAEQGIELISPWVDDEKRQAGAAVRAGRTREFATGKFQVSADEQTLICPAGAALVQIGTRLRHGLPVQQYQTEAGICQACVHKPECNPRQTGRVVERVIETEVMRQYHERMAKPETKELYRKRSQFSEFPNMKIKAAWEFRRFRLRGLDRVAKEAFWMVLAFTMDRWLLLRRQQATAVAA
jgi:transposase